MPQGEYPRIENKDEILRMYDRTMMNYVNFLAKLIDEEYKERLGNPDITIKSYTSKIEVLRIILGFNGNMEDK